MKSCCRSCRRSPTRPPSSRSSRAARAASAPAARPAARRVSPRAAQQEEAARKTEEEEADNKLARKIISMFGGGPAKAVRMSGLTEEEKREQMAIVLQATYRRHAERKRNAPQLWRVNLRYEVSILKGRQERRSVLFGFVQRTRAPASSSPPLVLSSPLPPPAFAMYKIRKILKVHR